MPSSKRRQKGVDSFRGRCGAADRKRKLAVGCDGRGEVLHCCAPLSQPARYSDARRHPFVPSPHRCPRGCATTTRRPRSRRRPRIGAGWNPVTKSINNQTASCACLRRETSSLRVMGTRVTRLLSAARLCSPIRRARDRTTTLGLEGIEDDNGLCYCSPASEN
jgi:hypothetical protein